MIAITRRVRDGLSGLLLVSVAVANGGEMDAPALGGVDWEQAGQEMDMLSQMGFHPFVMPLIMEHRDAIGLSNKQTEVFRQWRNKNRVPLIHAMNQILKERIAFQRIALNPDTSEEVLRAKQGDIFRLSKSTEVSAVLSARDPGYLHSRAVVRVSLCADRTGLRTRLNRLTRTNGIQQGGK